MSALADYLDNFNRLVPPCPSFQGIVTHITGPPTDKTSPFFMFAHDDSADRTYINNLRTSANWVEVADAIAIGAPNTITT